MARQRLDDLPKLVKEKKEDVAKLMALTNLSAIVTSNAANCKEEAEVRLGASIKKATESESCSQSVTVFSFFVVFHHSLQQFVGLSGFPLGCPLRSSLFHASLRRAAHLRWC